MGALAQTDAIEEAKEEIASIRKNLPAWAKAPDDMETLITVRRSFHTLKGSGRMVGAERIGERLQHLRGNRHGWSIARLSGREDGPVARNAQNRSLGARHF